MLNGLDIYSKFHDEYMIAGDYNAEESEPCLSQFLFEMNTENVKEPTCFKSRSNPNSTDLLIFKRRRQYRVRTGLSDFHKMVVSVLKYTFQGSGPKELVYRDYKNFDTVIFKRELEDKLNQQINEYKHFQQIFLEILNIHASIKKKLLGANHAPYMTKALKKAVMKRSELETKYVKNKTSDNLKSYKNKEILQ